jgi:hypothetical protein
MTTVDDAGIKLAPELWVSVPAIVYVVVPAPVKVDVAAR